MIEIAKTSFNFKLYPSQEGKIRNFKAKLRDSMDLLQKLTQEPCTKIAIPNQLLSLVDKTVFKNQQLITSDKEDECHFLNTNNYVVLHVYQ